MGFRWSGVQIPLPDEHHPNPSHQSIFLLGRNRSRLEHREALFLKRLERLLIATLDSRILTQFAFDEFENGLSNDFRARGPEVCFAIRVELQDKIRRDIERHLLERLASRSFVTSCHAESITYVRSVLT